LNVAVAWLKDESLFHINSGANGSPHEVMNRGDAIEVGKSTNPFFGFYENWTRTYPVRMKDGTTQHLPAIQFLRNVFEGNLTPDNLPKTALETARHFLMLARELVWENVRLLQAPDAPSRQRCIWLLKTPEEARKWVGILGFQRGCYSIVRVRATGKALDVDSNLLAADSEPLSKWYEKAGMYWHGETSASPMMETLFEGKLEVTEIVAL
jgi:hypothetical protein